MPKINREEYEILKGLDDKWKWIARDDNCDDSLFCFENRPYKNTKSGNWDPAVVLHYKYFGKHYSKFQFIQWEDEDPYNIQELIEEYEDYKGSWEHAIEFSGEVFGESEETEVKKDKEWMKEELGKLRRAGVIDIWAYRNLWIIANQLDEPEVLSQKWIDENEEQEEMYGSYGVSVDKLQNLLVPKQEEVDQAYKDGYEKGKQHATEKQSEETETVAGVLVDYLLASAKLKLALSMEVEELEE